jgi:hypothetical protein
MYSKTAIAICTTSIKTTGQGKMKNDFANRVYDIIDNGRSYSDLDNEEKVALTALKIKELPSVHKHEFFTDSKDSDELLEALIDYLIAWDLTRTQKAKKLAIFEEILERVVLGYDVKGIQEALYQSEGVYKRLKKH